LGRGGSDLTAVTLAHFLKADRCRLFKKTGGVLQVDPDLIPNDHRIERLSHLELDVFTQLGAKVIQPKAAQFARIHRVPFEVADSKTYECGTYVNDDVRPNPLPVWGLAVREMGGSEILAGKPTEAVEKMTISLLLTDRFCPSSFPLPGGSLGQINGIRFLSFESDVHQYRRTARVLYRWARLVNGGNGESNNRILPKDNGGYPNSGSGT
ncbi:MAG: hypothetical protein LBR62_01845, partial [Puniceicoccales bacterium]|nr:hypothetical protein [Puniceicoccales bacterium]